MSLLLTLGALSSAHAETMYVSDIQFVAVREGQSNSTRAVERGLKSGTPMEVLDRSDGYTQVRTPSGKIGWVADYFLSEDKVSRDQLIDLETQITQLTETKLNLESRLTEVSNQNNTLKQDVTKLAGDKMALEADIAEQRELVTQAQQIVQRNDDYLFEIESLKQRLESAESRADSLQSSHEQKWFMIGAGTLVAGLLAGLIAPMTRRKKPSTGSWV